MPRCGTVDSTSRGTEGAAAELCSAGTGETPVPTRLPVSRSEMRREMVRACSATTSSSVLPLRRMFGGTSAAGGATGGGVTGRGAEIAGAWARSSAGKVASRCAASMSTLGH